MNDEKNGWVFIYWDDWSDNSKEDEEQKKR